MLPLLALLLAAAAPPCHMPAPVPAEVLAKPAPALTRAGAVRDPVKTKSKKAQASYDRGVALLHAYDYVRAARSFHEALRHDAKLASAHLGLSIAHERLGDDAGARAAWREAHRLAPGASERERARIEAWGQALEGLAATEGEDRLAAARATLDAALARWPDDAELLLLRGNFAAPLPPGLGAYQREESVEWFQRVLAKQPEHPGAHHYLVHAYENEGRFADAEKHAATFAKLAPGAPHAIHMHGHALLRTGRVSDALARFEEADRVGAAIRKAEGIADEHDWHHSHNLTLLASAYRHQGRLKDAEATLRRLVAVPARGDDAHVDRKDLASFLLSRGRHVEALAAAEPLAQAPFAPARAIGHVLAGEALLAMGRRADAAARLEQAETARRAIDGPLAATWDWFVTLYTDELGGLLLLADGRREEAAARLGNAVANHVAMLGPDGFLQALFRLERIAAACRELGAWEIAKSVTDALVRHDPSYAAAHLAVAAVARHERRADAAQAAEKRARALWTGADAGLLP